MFAATVLAAGASTRMGTPKALLDYCGRSFLRSILDATSALDLHTVVAVGYDSDKVLAGHDLRNVTVVVNQELEAGPIGSIRASIKAVETEAIEALLVWPVDFPHVRLDTVRALLHRFAYVDQPAIVVPEYGGAGGHPVLFGLSVFYELLNAPNSGGARTVVRRDASRVARVPVSDGAVIDSINTPESYRDLLSRCDCREH